MGRRVSGSSSGVAHDPLNQGAPTQSHEFLQQQASMHEERTYIQLQQDLIKEIWICNHIFPLYFFS